MDTDIAITTALFLLFAGGFAWLIIAQNRAQKRRAAALDALAAQQRWRLARRTEGRRRVVEIAPEGGGWSLKLASGYSTGSSKARGSVPGFTAFVSDTPAWPDGRGVFSQRLPGGIDRMLGGAGMVGFFQNAALRTLLGRLIDPDTLRELDRLQPFEAPQGIELSILATEDPRGGNLRAIHEAVHGWQPRHARDRSPPAVNIGPEGTTLRLPFELREPDDIAAFVEQGRALAAALA